MSFDALDEFQVAADRRLMHAERGGEDATFDLSMPILHDKDRGDAPGAFESPPAVVASPSPGPQTDLVKVFRRP